MRADTPLDPVPPGPAAGRAGKSAKTLTRDVNALRKKGLIEVSGGRVRARREIILAFLPPRRAGEVREGVGASE